MPTSDSLLRLELLVAVCHQLPEAEADKMMWLAIDDPRMFTAEMLSASARQQLQLTTAQVQLLRRDLVARSAQSTSEGLTSA